MSTEAALKIATPATKECKCCHAEKPISEFYKNRIGYTNVCNDCVAIHRKEKRERKNEVADLRRQLDDRRSLALSDFTPREMMKHLANLGYEGTLVYVEKRKIDITKL